MGKNDKKTAAAVAEPVDPEATPPEETQASKLARGICATVRDMAERNAPRILEYVQRAEASPESGAAALEELEKIFRNAANFVGTRAAILRHGPQEPDPLLAVTARNVRGLLSDSAAMLDQACHAPGTWKRVQESLAEAAKSSKAVETLLVQDGAHLIARQDPPLADEAGNALVPASERG